MNHRLVSFLIVCIWVLSLFASDGIINSVIYDDTTGLAYSDPAKWEEKYGQKKSDKVYETMFSKDSVFIIKRAIIEKSTANFKSVRNFFEVNHLPISMVGDCFVGDVTFCKISYIANEIKVGGNYLGKADTLIRYVAICNADISPDKKSTSVLLSNRPPVIGKSHVNVLK